MGRSLTLPQAPVGHYAEVPRLPPLFLSLGLLAGAPALADAAGAQRLYYERTLMLAADGRCGLFTAAVAGALKAGAAQARGAALRGGADGIALDRAGAAARAKARATPCASPDLQTAAGRVRTGFDGWSRLTRLSLHGWSADRTRSAGRWRLSQTSDGVTLGLEGAVNRPAVVAVGGRTRAASVRLRIRDAGKDRHPDLRGRSLPERTPGMATSKVLWASSREPAPPALTPGGVEGGRLWRLPAEASAALAGLDPREAVAVEFVYAAKDREVVRPVLFEAGDFAAGLAFLQAGASR